MSTNSLNTVPDQRPSFLGEERLFLDFEYLKSFCDVLKAGFNLDRVSVFLLTEGQWIGVGGAAVDLSIFGENLNCQDLRIWEAKSFEGREEFLKAWKRFGSPDRILQVYCEGSDGVRGCLLGFQQEYQEGGMWQGSRELGHSLAAQFKLCLQQAPLKEAIWRSQEEHARVEAALKESQTFYHSLVECLPQNIFRKDLQEKFTFANQRFCRTLGRPLEEILDRTDFDFFPPEIAQKYQRDDRRVQETLAPFEAIEAHYKRNGEKIWVHVVKTPILDPSGKVIGIQGIFWDVTERKLMEETLAYERDLLRALLDNVPDAIYFKDVESKILKCSKALAHVVGLKNPMDLVGKMDFDLFSEFYAKASFQVEQEIVKTGKPRLGFIEKETFGDGKELWLLTSKLPFYNKDGVIRGTFGVSKDITDLMKAEQELARARDMALESVRLKGEFLANVSHELRTPMNGILGMIGLLLETNLSQEQKDYSQTIQTSATCLLEIINDILDFSKIEAGKLSLEEIPLSLKDLVEGTLDLMAEKAHAKGIEIESRLSFKIPKRIQGDPLRIRQILYNLVGNAIKFTDHGHILVEVQREIMDVEGDCLKFSVRDTGIGMPENAGTRIFEAFTQADGSTTRRFGGTGLGLAISRQLVGLMGGRIGMESSPGKGSHFWFYFPLKLLPGNPTDDGSSPSMSHLRVLVVDDSEVIRETVRHHCDFWGIQCSLADHPKEALREIERLNSEGVGLDIVFLDHRFLEFEGVSFTRRLKSSAMLQKPKVVLLACLGHHINANELEVEGIDGHLCKPIRSGRFRQCLARLLPARDAEILSRDEEEGIPDGLGLPGIISPFGRPGVDLRILLAEDNLINQKVALYLLKKLGVVPEVVGNGVEVLREIQSRHFDVILMDCQMPEMDGYEATLRIRELERQNTWPNRSRPHFIVAMTANVMTGDREKCLTSGMDAYLKKPVVLDDLKSCLFGRTMGGVDTLHTGHLAGPQKASEVSAPSEAGEIPVLDRTFLDRMNDPAAGTDGKELIRRLIDLFVKDLPKHMGTLDEAMARREWIRMKKTSHTLKGSSSNLGAMKLAQCCGALEKNLSDENEHEIAERLKGVHRAASDLKVSLDQYLSR